MFVTFEGPEGSGKSLQARLLVDALRTQGVAVTHTREPGGTPLGERLRDLLLHQSQPTARTEALLMCAARAQHVQDVLRPALERGEVVVCDRFTDSTLAYQGYGRGLDLAALAALNAFATGGLTPDLTVLLDLPVEVGLARKHAEQNRFEAETVAFHERVRAGYRALAAAEPARWLCLDARRPPDELAEAIRAALASRLGQSSAR